MAEGSDREMDAAPLAAIFGCAGSELTADERAFFREVRPFGFILFARNIIDPPQVADLTRSLREAAGDERAPVLIDQEGGRVQRLRPPHWRDAPPAAVFGKLYDGAPEAGKRACYLNYRLIAAELQSIGVDVDCVPCLDVPIPGAHDIIGDRAYSANPDVIAALGRQAANGLLDGGVFPIAKHIPGHGRARSDSHLDLPVVDAPVEALRASDFRPFHALRDLPFGMTAHIVYTGLDGDRPATVSPVLIDGTIRREIGFDGLLMTDDLSMKALAGDFRDRAADSLAAGCDLVLHCNGDMAEMRAVADGARPLDREAQRRWRNACALRKRSEPDDTAFDTRRALEELDALLHA